MNVECRDTSATSSDDYCIVLRPNCSLSLRGAVKLFVALTAAAAGIAGFFLFAGAWPVLPYVILELAVIGAVLILIRRRAHESEVITLDPKRLSIVKSNIGGESRYEFSCYWARVTLRSVRDGWYPSRLVIRSHGREVEIATDVSEEIRRSLAQRLGRFVGSAYTDRLGEHGCTHKMTYPNLQNIRGK